MPGSPSGSPSDGVSPLPSLPVDSAISCSAHAPKSAILFDDRIVTLSRPSRPAMPIASPSCTPGFSCGGTSGPHDRTIESERLRTFARSTPAAAAGTSPNGDSTEYPPADGRVAMEDTGKTLCLCDLFQRRTGVGHRHEMPAGLAGTDSLAH